MFDKIYIANDHGGYEAKLLLVKYLHEKGYVVEDMGSHSEEIVRYPYYAAKAAHEVVRNANAGGILICSTGIGMSIIANKFKGIRAALCTDSYMAKMTRRHNNSNILCLGGKITGEFEIYDIVENWLDSEYEGGRHDISLGLIKSAEDELFGNGECSLAYINAEEQL
jgi:ribose 5-phosphate isomerase B